MTKAMIVLLISTVCIVPANADPALDVLVTAYPDHLAGYDDKDLIWKDGTRMPISDGRTNKSFEQLLEDPDIKDQFAIPYPLGPDVETPAINVDPGRIRNDRFFTKMYGDCHKGEVTRRLKPVAWVPARGGRPVSVTSVNGVNERLAAVVNDLETLSPAMTKFLVPSAGTYNCRDIKNTSRLSVHAYAAAIDINDRQADYWEFLKDRGGQFTWRNRVPGGIGEIFERHGFIWGAKWFHVDSMHFEYRPELIMLAKQANQQRPKK